MRTEVTTRTRTETATIRAQSASLRRDVDALSARLKEGMDGLKHECVLGLSWPYARTPTRWLQNPNGHRKPEERRERRVQEGRPRDRGALYNWPGPAAQIYVCGNAQAMLNKSLVTLYDLRSDVEEVKWDNMRKSVGESIFRVLS